MGRAAPLVVVLSWLFLQGCSEPDHDALAARDASGSGGSGGAVVDAPDADGDAADAMEDGDVSGPSDAEPADSSFVPDGPSVFTFVHGMPDVRAIRVCFEVDSAGVFAPLAVAPVPDDLIGLSYAESMSATTVPGNVDLEVQAIRPVVYAGELSAIEGLLCDALATPPQGVRSVALQAIPAGTLSRGRSVLMVAAGCMGGDEVDGGLPTEVCGKDFVPPEPNASLLVASMDRTPGGAMGFQVFAASIASGPLTVDHLTAFPSMTTTLAKDVAAGEIAPVPPMTDLSVADLGTSPEQNTVRVFGDNLSEPAEVTPLTVALERGGLSIDAMSDDQNYAVVLVGPKPGTSKAPWHKAFSIVVIPADP